MIKFGIIGIGRRGRIAVEFKPENAELAGIAEVNPKEVERFKTEYPVHENIFITGDYRELLKRKDIEAVFVMCRDSLHEQLTVDALTAGKSVYLEKPMAISIEGCDRILDAAYRTGSKLMVGHNMRFMPFVLKMKQVIDSGIIGDIQCVWVRHFINYGSCYFRHWCAEKANCCGLLLQKGSHDIDVIHWLAGGFTRKVIGMGKLSVYNRCRNRLAAGESPDRKISFTEQCWPPLELKGLSPKLDVEDHNMIMMELDNGIQANYSQCMYAPDNDRNYTFIGTHGRVENLGRDQVMIWTHRGDRRLPDESCRVSNTDFHSGADPKIVRRFFEFVAGKSTDIPSPVAARNAVAAGVKGHESMRNGNAPLEVPFLPNPKWYEYFSGGQKK